MQARDTIYVAGSWVAPSDATSRIEVVNPFTEQVIGTVPAGTPDDVDRAVAAARDAFEAWSGSPPETRAKYLQRITEGLQARADEFAATIASEVGMPIRPLSRWACPRSRSVR